MVPTIIEELLPYIKLYYSDIESKETHLTLRSNHMKIFDLLIFKDILANTNENYSNKARCYLYILNKRESICNHEECNNITKFDNEKNKFREFCSITCRNKSEKLRKQISNTWTEEKKQIKNNRTKQTCLEKYGTENPMQNKEVKQKAINTCNLKYGGNSATYKHMMNMQDYNKDFITANFIKDRKLNHDKFIKYFNLSGYGIKTIMNYHNIEIEKRVVSKPEQEIQNLLSDSGIIYKNNIRTIIKGELDIYIPSLQIAIEFNGIYYHSYGYNNKNIRQNDYEFQKNRHLNKTIQCEEQGIKLFHIFEDEWNNSIKKEIWKSLILKELNRNELVTEYFIKEIDNQAAKEFFNLYNLEGYSQGSIYLGVYRNNELIGSAEFIKNKNSYYNLNYCSKNYFEIPNLESKLIEYFKNNIENEEIHIILNRRWHSILDNKKQLLEITLPNHFYIKNGKLHSRLQFQKHKLKNILETYDETQTGLQNMLTNNYRVIYDSGNLVYKLN